MKPMRPGGQMRRKTRPTMLDSLIAPLTRASEELVRLSPITNTLPAGKSYTRTEKFTLVGSDARRGKLFAKLIKTVEVAAYCLEKGREVAA